MGNCAYCGKKAGFLRSQHKECEAGHESGMQEMASLARKAALTPDFREAALRQSLADVARRSVIGDNGIDAAIATAISVGWRQAVAESMADGILTMDEEARLRDFRDRLALETTPDTSEVLATLDRASRDRLMLDARLAAMAETGGEQHLTELAESIADSGMSPASRKELLAQAWEAAVDSALEDGVLSLDQEAALLRYRQHFNLSTADINSNGAHTNMVKAAVIREAAEGIVPQRQNFGSVPFNLMKSEQLVWVIDDVKYHEMITRRERRGTSHGLSVRVTRGLYYRPSMFRSQQHEWEETVHADTGLLGVTSKHVYFHGARKRFRVRYDKIVSFEMYGDGFGMMRDAQSAKPQSFRTGDGWFIYNLVTNLARHE